MLDDCCLRLWSGQRVTTSHETNLIRFRDGSVFIPACPDTSHRVALASEAWWDLFCTAWCGKPDASGHPDISPITYTAIRCPCRLRSCDIRINSATLFRTELTGNKTRRNTKGRPWCALSGGVAGNYYVKNFLICIWFAVCVLCGTGFSSPPRTYHTEQSRLSHEPLPRHSSCHRIFRLHKVFYPWRNNRHSPWRPAGTEFPDR